MGDFPDRGGSRNSLTGGGGGGGGGGFWARILRRGGLGSRSVGIFIYWQANNNKKPLKPGGV